MTPTAQSLIESLDLRPHPEGGYFRETYRCTESLAAAHLPQRFGGDRACSTAIYFLLEAGDFSAFHRIKADEIWHFYAGDPVLVHQIDATGSSRQITLGNGTEPGQVFQAVVPASTWFAAEVAADGTFALVGCTVAPGFDFADFEMAERGPLGNRFPRHRDLIARLTRG